MLSEVFHLNEFKENQLRAIMMGHDCLVLMPTGGGKSLCFEIPAIFTNGVTLVVSSLKSLVLDQVKKLQTLNIPAQNLSGDQNNFVIAEIYGDKQIHQKQKYYS